MINLTPAEEHYLKRELLRLEVSREFESLNDIYALRKFGEPFSEFDPKEASTGKNRNRNLNLSPKRIFRSSTDSCVDAHNPENNLQLVTTEFPILSHFLHNFIMTFPLLSGDMVNDSTFWQGKVQVFFEHFMGMPFSSSFDREQLTKRRKLSLKMSKAILLFYNSGIAVSKETDYYANDNYQLVHDSEKATKLNKFTMPSKESLKYLLTDEPVFLNGIDINIISVIDESNLPIQLRPKKNKNTAGSWIKSNLGVDLAKLSIIESSKHKRYYFIIKVRTKDPDGTFCIYRSYSDFKKLAHNLKSCFPGKNIPKLPHKNKMGASIHHLDKASASHSRTADGKEIGEDEIDYEEFEENIELNKNILPRERMRTSLRQYLRILCKDKEISISLPLKLFMFSESTRISCDAFTDKIKHDIENREHVDLTNLENQMLFQKIAFERSLRLQNSLKEFKTSLLKDEKFLLSIFRELKEKREPSDLSPVLRDFFDWCKIYISATIYQMFLGNDGSYELYSQVRRLHKLVPYTVMTQILRFTNPLAIMKGMMDLFMAQPFGGHSLLQTIFSTILTDDLKSKYKLVLDLENVIKSTHPYGKDICTFLEKSILENEQGTFVNMDTVHDEAAMMNMPMCIIMAMKGMEMGFISSDTLAELMESFTYWKKEQISGDNPISVHSNDSVSDTKGIYFLRVKEYLHLLIEERDKRLMKQLWDDPELSQLLKAMVTLFYGPMIRVFKIAQMDVAFKNFERFMDDLIDLLDSIIDGNKGSTTMSGIVDDINLLVNKHETSFYQFAHDIYVNDSEGIFEGFIKWFSSIINFLQNSKYSALSGRVNLEALLKETSCDVSLLKLQLGNVISKKLKSRKVYSELVKIKSKQDKETPENVNEIMDKRWKKLTNIVIPNESSDFGIVDSDLVDLDLDIQDYDYLCGSEEKELEKMYREILEKEVDVSEIKNFLTNSFNSTLKDILF